MEEQVITAEQAPTGAAAGTSFSEGSVPAPQKPQPEGRAFTQEDVNRLLAAERRQQEARFADYETAKAAAAKWAEHEGAQKTEAEKTQELLTKLQRERDEALATANDRLIRAAFMAAATRAGAQFPEDVFALADRAEVKVDAQGNVSGVDAAVETVVKAGRVPLMTTQPAAKTPAARLDGGAGAAQRSGEKSPAATDDEVAMAAKLGIPLERYLERRKEVKSLRS